jgi:hypothetical protein
MNFIIIIYYIIYIIYNKIINILFITLHHFEEMMNRVEAIIVL